MKNVIITSFLFIFSLFFIIDVKALEYDSINSNINVNSSWNNYNFNSNNYISANAQGWFNEVSIKYSLTFDADSNICPFYNANYDQFEYFVLDVCSTSDVLGGGNFYNDNGFTDLIYKTNSSCSVGGYQGKIFKLFVRMNTNFSCNIGTSNNNFVTLTNKSNNIYLFNSSNYNVPLRFTNIYYYDSSTYDSLLNDYSNMNSYQQTNDKLDDITNMDIPDSSKEELDDSSYQDYQDAEDALIDSIGEADLDSVDIAIDNDSSNFIWDTITDILQSHPLIMSTVIAILSIGIIKLALGR